MSETKPFRNNIQRPLGGLATVFVSLLLLTSCGGEAGSDTDQAALSKEIASSEFFVQDLTTTDEDADALSRALAAPPGGMAEKELLAPAEGSASLPIFWWREDVRRVSRDLDIDIAGNTASVTVTDHLKGNLRVIQHLRTLPWKKPFEESLTRHAEFTRNPLEEQPPRWKLTKLSPVDASLEDPTQQTVHIDWVRASQCVQLEEGGVTCADWQKVWESFAPSTLFEVPQELPTFFPEDRILVETKVSNTETHLAPPEFVFLHRPGMRFGNIFGRVRDRMFDDGTHGDQLSGDGIYSHDYTIVNPGRHFAAVDVMNAATLAEENAAYNSTGWGIPYRVVEP